MRLFKRPKADIPERRRPERLATSTSSSGGDAFRRGRTLTGSSSSSVRTANEAKADLKSGRVHAHALTKKRRQLTIILMGILVLVAGFYILASQFTADAMVTASPDPSLQLDADYAEQIDQYLGDHMSERWRFLTNTDRLTAYVQLTAPEVESIRLRGSAGFGKSMFEIAFRQPIASWDVNSRQLFVDTNGVPFARNYFAPPTLRITDQSGIVSTGTTQSVMSNRFMSYIGQVIGLAKDKGYAAEQIEIPEGMTRQINLRLKDIPYPVKLSSDRQAGESIEDMVQTIEWLKRHQITPEYIDVRVDSKVFYK